jgi:hypothetical protein
MVGYGAEATPGTVGFAPNNTAVQARGRRVSFIKK